MYRQANQAIEQVLKGKIAANEALLLDAVKFDMTVELPTKYLRVIVKTLGMVSALFLCMQCKHLRNCSSRRASKGCEQVPACSGGCVSMM